MSLASLLAEAQACRRCADFLPLGPRPVLRATETARLLIVGQAPGTRVHASGLPFDDPSGNRLREWLAIDRGTFYDDGRIAIVPMGLCYPGRDSRGGDRPPVPGCADLWHDRLRSLLPQLELTLLVGRYAQAFYLGASCRPTLTETVRTWGDYLPDFMPLPHPSWRNTAWLARNPWFGTQLLPDLRRRIAAVLRD